MTDGEQDQAWKGGARAAAAHGGVAGTTVGARAGEPWRGPRTTGRARADGMSRPTPAGGGAGCGSLGRCCTTRMRRLSTMSARDGGRSARVRVVGLREDPIVRTSLDGATDGATAAGAAQSRKRSRASSLLLPSLPLPVRAMSGVTLCPMAGGRLRTSTRASPSFGRWTAPRQSHLDY
jgi:hypothetical protein